ncbi:MAG: hypothetical protein ACREVB_10865, partial [Burkholderiales bacterium]
MIGLATRPRARSSLKRPRLISLTPGFLFRERVTRARNVRVREATFLEQRAEKKTCRPRAQCTDESRRTMSPRPP